MLQSRCFIYVMAICLLSVMAVFAEVPNQISYQGRLTDDAGAPVADGEYSIVFNIYNTKILVGVVLWTDTMTVTTSEGLFTVLLGEETPLSPDIFDGTTKYLGITIVGEEEMSPRTPIVSVPYAIVAGNAVSAEIDCHDCDTIFVNATGPETITATDASTTLTIINTGNDVDNGIFVEVEGINDTSEVTGVKVSASNTSAYPSAAYGGRFLSIDARDGLRCGVYGNGRNNSISLPAYGVNGVGQNYAPNGTAYGGYFAANGGDPSRHIGACGYSYGHGVAQAIGLYGDATNPDEGFVAGGKFIANTNGTGRHFGTHSTSNSNGDSVATGVYGYASNFGAGRAYGGEFMAESNGIGKHFGVVAIAETDNDSSAYGVYGEAFRTSPGYAYGGYFTASGTATTNATGVIGYVSNPGPATGIYTFASGSGNGTVRGAQLVCHSSGTGIGRGVDVYVLGGSSSDDIYGVDIMTDGGSNYTGTSYGGYFNANAMNLAGNQYALYGLSESMSSTYASFGTYGRSQHYGGGNSYGGYFVGDSSGTGTSYGTRTIALSKGTAAAYGISSVAANRSTGTVYGGYFEMLNYGTGGGYGIYAKARTTGAPASWAGHFEGHVKVTGVLSVLGTKSASVKVDDGTYHNLYCQESPENWFEDFGEGQLTDGRAHIELDQLFLQTVTIDQDNPMKVFVQLNDPDCNGTAVIRGKTGFDVVELMNGTGHASFSYRVVAKRRGYEQVRLDTMLGPTPEEAAAEAVLINEQLEADMRAADEDRIKRQEVESRREAERSVSPEDVQY